VAKNKLKLTEHTKTWIIDLDGTILKHNGYLIDNTDTLLPGVKDFFLTKIKKGDYILIITARKEEYREQTIEFLRKNGIRFNNIIFSAPKGERIVINDTKPKGMATAYAIPVQRDIGLLGIDIVHQGKK